MFLTLTLPSYGKVRDGVPVDPDRYDYRRAALDALHFPKLVDRFWQNLRRCAGYKVQYFAAVEPQHRLAPHLHAAVRGAIPRATIRQVAQATYAQVWWPSFDQAVYVHRTPVWVGTDYVDPDTGAALPTWEDAVAAIPDDRPAHVMRFGTQLDMAGIIAPSADADRAVRYLTKYLAKSIAATYTDDDDVPNPAYMRARRPAAHRAALAAVQRALRQLAPLRRPTQRRRTRNARRPVQFESPRPGEPRPRRPPRPRLSAMVRQDPPANTKPTGPPSSAKPCSTPASSPPRSSGSPPTSPCPTADPGSSGPTPKPTRRPTPGSSSPPSSNSRSGAANTKPRNRLCTAVRQLSTDPDG